MRFNQLKAVLPLAMILVVFPAAPSSAKKGGTSLPQGVINQAREHPLTIVLQPNEEVNEWLTKGLTTKETLADYAKIVEESIRSVLPQTGIRLSDSPALSLGSNDSLPEDKPDMLLAVYGWKTKDEYSLDIPYYVFLRVLEGPTFKALGSSDKEVRDWFIDARVSLNVSVSVQNRQVFDATYSGSTLDGSLDGYIRKEETGSERSGFVMAAQACADGLTGLHELYDCIQGSNKKKVLTFKGLLDKRPELVKYRFANGYTALQQVVRAGLSGPICSNRVELATVLIEKGADVNARGRKGDTALHVFGFWDANLADLLFAKGADVNAKNDAGKTPLAVQKPWKEGIDNENSKWLRNHGGVE